MPNHGEVLGSERAIGGFEAWINRRAAGPHADPVVAGRPRAVAPVGA